VDESQLARVCPAGIDTLAVDLAPGDAPPAGALVTVAPVIGVSPVGVSPVGVSMSSEPEAVVPEAVPETAVPETAVPESLEAAGEQAAEAGIRKWSLSPSRAADFMTCPLLYRFRVIDKLPEAPSAAAARGTLVHAVLERLFDVPALGRSPEAAAQLIEPEWQRLIAAEPELADVFGDEAETKTWLTQARAMLDRYFTLEDPKRLEPAHRELQVQAVLSSGLRLRGYIDRLDVSPAGDVRIVDYKTGTAPRAEFEARALFQMKFYALALWRSMGTVPRLLQLMYLGNGEVVRYSPDEADLLATERKIDALWRAIEKARDAADWRPRRGRLCAWCSHQQFCPEFGGTPPPLPASGAAGQSSAGDSAEPAQPAELSHIVDLVDL
jgi:putative RecB family exonuclease